MTTGEITQAAIKYFTDLGFKVWRNNQIPQRGRPFRGLTGVPDIIGYCVKDNRFMPLDPVSVGKFFACEIKNVGDKLSEEQKDFLITLNRCGGFGYLAEPDGQGGIKYRLYHG